MAARSTVDRILTPVATTKTRALCLNHRIASRLTSASSLDRLTASGRFESYTTERVTSLAGRNAGSDRNRCAYAIDVCGAAEQHRLPDTMSLADFMQQPSHEIEVTVAR